MQASDLSSALGMATGDEADLEDAARIGDRIYALGSHGRNKDGELAPTRRRFLAIDLAGAVPALQLTVAGRSDRLVTDLSVATSADLALEVHGLNIEGLAAYPGPATPERLLIGLRNPQAAGRAILITLMNPAAVVAGGTAHFGEVIRLDLGGAGVRGLAWSDVHQAMLIIGGPIADAGAVRLFRWSGDPAVAPVVIVHVA